MFWNFSVRKRLFACLQNPKMVAQDEDKEASGGCRLLGAVVVLFLTLAAMVGPWSSARIVLEHPSWDSVELWADLHSVCLYNATAPRNCTAYRWSDLPGVSQPPHCAAHLDWMQLGFAVVWVASLLLIACTFWSVSFPDRRGPQIGVNVCVGVILVIAPILLSYWSMVCTPEWQLALTTQSDQQQPQGHWSVQPPQISSTCSALISLVTGLGVVWGLDVIHPLCFRGMDNEISAVEAEHVTTVNLDRETVQ